MSNLHRSQVIPLCKNATHARPTSRRIHTLSKLGAYFLSCTIKILNIDCTLKSLKMGYYTYYPDGVLVLLAFVMIKLIKGGKWQVVQDQH